MKAVYTKAALGDLDDILAYLTIHYPNIVTSVENRIRRVVAGIAEWPESAPRIEQHSIVRVRFVGKYPYRIFYRIVGDTIEIVHIHHTGRKPLNKQ